MIYEYPDRKAQLIASLLQADQQAQGQPLNLPAPLPEGSLNAPDINASFAALASNWDSPEKIRLLRENRDLRREFDQEKRYAEADLRQGKALSDSFHAQPATVDTTFEPLNTLQQKADARGKGTVWSVDKDGKMVVTNTPETRSAAGYFPSQDKEQNGAVVSTNTGINPSPMQSFKTQMEDIVNTADPDLRYTKLTQLQNSFGRQMAAYRDSADKLAAGEFNVDALRSQLAQNEAEDRKHPAWSTFQSDSEQTAMVRAQYEAALSGARLRADSIFQKNQDAVGLEVEVSNFLKQQLGMWEKAETRKDMKAADREEKLSQMEAAMGTSHLTLSKLMWNKDGSNEDFDPVAAAAKQYTNKEFLRAAEAMSQNPIALAPMAAEGNAYARTALIHKQAAAMAGTEDVNSVAYRDAEVKAEQQVNSIMEVARSDASFWMAAEKIYGKETAATKFADYKLKSTTARSESERKELAAARMDFALGMMRDSNELEFKNQVQRWTSSAVFEDTNSSIGRAYLKAKEGAGAGNISIGMMVSAISQLPEEQRAGALDMLVKAGQAHTLQVSRGVFGGFGDSLDVRTEVNKYVKESILSQIGATILQDAALGAGAGIGAGFLAGGIGAIPGAGMGAGVGALVGTGHAVTNLLTGQYGE